MTRPLSALAAALAAAAVLSSAAVAATPRDGGTYSGLISGGGKAAVVNTQVTDGALGILDVTWTCQGGKKADHQSFLVVTPDQAVPVAADGTFSVTRVANTNVGDPFDWQAKPKRARAKVTVTGTFTSATTLEGTVKATLKGCSTGTKRYAAALQNGA